MLTLKEKHEYEEEIAELKGKLSRFRNTALDDSEKHKSLLWLLKVNSKKLDAERNKNIKLTQSIQVIRKALKGL